MLFCGKLSYRLFITSRSHYKIHQLSSNNGGVWCICLRAYYRLGLKYAIIIVEVMLLCFGIFNSPTGILAPILYTVYPEVISLMFMIFGSLAALALSCLICQIINKYFIYSETGKSQYALMLLTPLLLIFMAGMYINHTIYSNTVVITKSGHMLNANHMQMLVIQIIGIGSLFSINYAYKRLVDGFKVSAELSIMERERYYQIQYVTEAKTRYENTQSFRHDIRNHLVIMQGLLDILISNKMGMAKNSGITVICSLKVPSPCPFPEMDICIILSNALDNAIHACEKVRDNAEKYIHITGCWQEDIFLTEIENSHSGKLQWKKGIGFSNIKTAADKYHGAMSIDSGSENFRLSVLLVIPQQPENNSRHLHAACT